MCCNQFIALSACLVVLHIIESSLRVPAQGVVSERFHSELFQKAPDFLTQIMKTSINLASLRTKPKNFMR